MRGVVPAAATALAGALAWIMLGLPAPAVNLAQLVAQRMPESGVAHPVTAVLLNFRGYDTLLEIGVLLLAVFGVLALPPGDAGAPVAAPGNPVLAALVQALVPLMLLVAGYLLWAGTHRPGGAFQAGAVLAAAGVLLRLAGRLPALLPPRFMLRAGLLAGFAVFVAVALGALLAGDALLQYPRAWAGALIVSIETALAISTGLILASLFIGAAGPGR